MSDEATLTLLAHLPQYILALVAIVAPFVTGYYGARMAMSVSIAELRKDVRALKEEVGTADSGLRGALRGTESVISEHERRIDLLEYIGQIKR